MSAKQGVPVGGFNLHGVESVLDAVGYAGRWRGNGRDGARGDSFALKAAEVAPGDGGATFEITLVAMEPVEGPLEGLIKECGGRRLGGFVFGGDDFALVPGGANEVVEGFEFEEALRLEFVVPGIFEVEIELVLRFGDAETPGEPTGAHGVLGRAGLAFFGARAGGQLRVEPVDIGAGGGSLD